MYRCQTCGTVSAPGKTMRKYIIYRESCHHCGTEIEQEIPVCEGCADALARGETLSSLSSLRVALGGATGQRARVIAPLAIAPRAAEAIALEDDDETSITLKEAGDTLGQVTYVPRCDICGHPAGDGQVTEHTTLCKFHSNMT